VQDATTSFVFKLFSAAVIQPLSDLDWTGKVLENKSNDDDLFTVLRKFFFFFLGLANRF